MNYERWKTGDGQEWIAAERFDAAQTRIREFETAIRSISEHNHPPNDKWGNRTIWTAGCPACNPVETVTAALDKGEKTR